MLISKYYGQIKIRSYLWLVIPLVLLVFAVVFMDRVWSNPPNGYLITYALGIFLFIWFCGALFPSALRWSPLRLCGNFFAYFGRKSMDIFLYHSAFLMLAKRHLAIEYISEWWGLVVYVVVIILSILVGTLITRGIDAVGQRFRRKGSPT